MLSMLDDETQDELLQLLSKINRQQWVKQFEHRSVFNCDRYMIVFAIDKNSTNTCCKYTWYFYLISIRKDIRSILIFWDDVKILRLTSWFIVIVDSVEDDDIDNIDSFK